ncbi:5-formyltetrahydrofolate cyclo-ligase [Aneurinibacillus sp. UBA3580]|jgi:5-formyltetrahydrofolate cyclo-ligase|uniref:5-formyltetrahydrofolate cyclo-ligase n=1 Tax=Aneurinibacillus sp. UBA3580 TaxID=1946041 RepID=UPI00257DF214|nr:5-formyltetrahydrofolate cyclo-ligase [Aneurinibacillus sp. UBA3580]
MDIKDRKEDKRQLRRQILRQRAEMSEQERMWRSRKIVERLLAVPEVWNAQRLFTFLSFGDEVCLDTFVNACCKASKDVYVPKTYPEEKRMVPYRFSGWNTLTRGVYGIREPDEAECEPWLGEPFDVIIVPGVAFTKRGERLGYGGGFYDRFFTDLGSLPPLFAVCYEMQMVPSLPVEEHDHRIDRIITECRSIVCS